MFSKEIILAQARKIELAYIKSQLNDKTRVSIYKKLGSLLRNGVPILTALNLLWKQQSKDGTKKGDPITKILESWILVIKQGGTVGQAISPWVPASEQMLLLAGDRSGDLPSSLEAATEVVTSGKDMKSAITGGLAYPGMLMVAAMSVLYLFGVKVIPQFTKIVDTAKWDGMAYVMLVMSNTVQTATIPILVGLLGLIVLVVYSLPRWVGPSRVIADRFAPWSMYKLWQGSSFLMSLQSLLKAGVPLEKALVQIEAMANPWLKERISAVIFGLRSGLSFGASLEKAGHGFPDENVIDEISIYSNLGGFDRALEIISRQWMVEGVESVRAKANILKGLAMAIMAGVVAGLASGMISIQQLVASSVQGG